MSKIRVYELAKMLGLSNKDLMQILEDLGVDVKTHMSSIDAETAQIIEESLGEPKTKDKPSDVKEKGKKVVNVPPGSSVSDVANLLGIKPADAVKALLEAGKMIPAGATANREILDILSEVFNAEFVVADSAQEEQEKDKAKSQQRKKPEGKNLQPRAPIVTVMGHVDHGKTSLLDYVRKTKVTEREAGGITQHIGASTLEYNGRKIVFLDTPGHEAFTSMRARGAQVTDIVILVVAADDGVMPQTVEALNHAKASGVPIVVAVNKIDKPEARPDRVRQQLSEHGLIPEEWGGDTIFVDISAKTGVGIDQLLEMVLLVADMHELKADPTVDPRGVIIEAKLDRGKGPVATVIVQEGT
jgi:translation initiation factor IF-2